jgi:hypothetical protein
VIFGVFLFMNGVMDMVLFSFSSTYYYFSSFYLYARVGKIFTWMIVISTELGK